MQIDQRTRLGVLTTSYPRYSDDFAGNFVYGLNRELRKENILTDTLVPFSPVDDAPVDIGNTLLTVRNDFKVHQPAEAWTTQLKLQPGSKKRYPKSREDLTAWTAAIRLSLQQMHATQKQCRHWDAIICHWLLPSGLTAATTALNIPRFMIAHGSDIHLIRRLPSLIRTYLWQLLVNRNANGALIFVSKSLRDIAAHSAPNAIKPKILSSPVLPMGVDIPCSPKPGSNNMSTTEISIGYLGRLIPSKGVGRLLDAVSQLKHGTEPIACHIIGDGPERETLINRASRMRRSVTFHGTVTGQAKWDLLSKMNVVVLPYERTRCGAFDGAPVTPLEILAAGVPLICSDIALEEAPKQIVRKVAHGSTDAITSALNEFIKDPTPFQNQITAGQHWAKTQSWQNQGHKFVKLIRANATIHT